MRPGMFRAYRNQHRKFAVVHGKYHGSSRQLMFPKSSV